MSSSSGLCPHGACRPHSRRVTQHLPAACLLGIVALTLAGCGGGGGGGAVTVSVTPPTVSLAAGATQTFVATVNGSSNTAVAWTATGGTVTADGLYTAPGTAGTYTVTATSSADPSKHATATVTATGPLAVGVTVSPPTAALVFGASQTFTATVTNSANTSVTWSVDGGNANGTITATGTYTAPPSVGQFTARATSVADPAKSASAQITVTAPVSVTVSPTAITLAPSALRTFRAAVANTANTAVTWSVDGGAANGAITAGGVYTAPAASGVYTVRATSVADNTKSGTALVTVPAAPFVVSTFGAGTYAPGVGLVVTLNVVATAGTSAYGVEDQVPSGWTVAPASISDGGTFDAVTRKVKWGPFFDNATRSLTYTATPPVGASGIVTFAGTGAFDSATGAIVGDRSLGN